MLGRTSRAVSEATRTRWNAAAATELDPRPSTPRYRQHRWALPLERQYSHRERRGGVPERVRVRGVEVGRKPAPALVSAKVVNG